MKYQLGLAAVGTLMLAACATNGLRAQSDHDPAQDFSRYRTYAWIADEPLVTPRGQPVEVSPLNRQRIVSAVESELTGKGFRKTNEPASADFVVSYTVGARDRLDVASYPTVYGGPWRWGYPYFGPEVDVRMYTEGTLSIDIFDGHSHQPVWHGWGSKRLTERDIKRAAELIPPAVRQILGAFPPGSARVTAAK